MVKYNIAAPSCVILGTVAANARALAGRVVEVGLCFFETQACLAYTEEDLPPDLAQLPLQWHVHLPVDLPWTAGGQIAAETAIAVFDKALYLAPRLAVLHPPEGTIKNKARSVPLTRPASANPHEETADNKTRLLQDFAQYWQSRCTIPLLLENICGNPLTDLPHETWDIFKICLDLAHVLAYNQYDLLRRADLLERVTLLHWSAPGAGDQHLPLTALTPPQMAMMRTLVRRVPTSALHMVEVFNLEGVEASVPVLQDILEPVQ